ncbi:PREDICTED: uncharacterized protein LOC109224127 [Nicotiana attenuata]|uniref:uncharacterized protein LOC109224127 n=1 Tax=Nicotiana attenuata TaxID=49451 RepID=UPI0009050958|nr:PREDICTED: uncharacterized protein LOC109224127 [Nicotiana attenuata]
MRSLWDELNSSPVCSCGALPKFIEDQQLFQFLNGLNESYSTVKSAIMMMNPLRLMSKAYSLLQRDESQREAHSSVPSLSGDTSSFLISTGSSNGNRTFSQKVNFESRKSNTNVSCKYCKKHGHTVDKYYRLHGFPPDFKFTKNKKSASCVQTEHVFTPSTPLHAAPTTQFHESSAHGFTKEHYQHLLALFQQARLSSGSTHDESTVDNTAFAHLQGPSLKRPLEIGKAAGRLYYLYPDADLFPVTSTSMSASHSFVSLHVFVPSINTSPVVDHVVDVVSCQTMLLNWGSSEGTHFFNSEGILYQTTIPHTPQQNGVVERKYKHLLEVYKLLYISNHSIFFSRDVVFHEYVFPYKSDSSPVLFPLPTPDSVDVLPTPVSHTHGSDPSPSTNSSLPHSSPTPSFSSFHHSPVSLPAPSSSPSSSSSALSPTPPFIPLRRSSRLVIQLVHLKDYVFSSVLSLAFPPSTKVSCVDLHMHESQLYQQAVSNPAWQEAMLKEFQALETN